MAGIARVALVAPLLALAPLTPATALADGADCRVIDVGFLPADHVGPPMRTPLQIVAWLETPAGAFVDTVYITQATGTFGLGNRPGRMDFNSGPMWPYGRRTTVFPVWAHRHGIRFDKVVFQDGRDSDLSHSTEISSTESHYCQPLRREETMWSLADAGTCATVAFTDKGRFSDEPSLYPPRADLERLTQDDPSVDVFRDRNPFDAISQATPISGAPTSFTYSLSPTLPPGEYVLFVETAREFDHNATYTVAAYPSPPGISFADWGRPYRGQPSIVYRTPFTLAAAATTASTASYAGYGDPDGNDGALRPPDGTITTDVVGSGAQRLALTGGARVRITARPEPDFSLPAAPAAPTVVDVTSRGATISFIEPGDDEHTGKVAAYELRLQAGGDDITEATFDDAAPIVSRLRPNAPGAGQSFEISNLMFETEYVVAIRAVDDCRNRGAITTVRFETLPRATGEVDACFVATAAYGSPMARDVDTLRHFRDAVLRKTVLGELAVEAYYTFGPAIAGVIGESDLLRATARGALRPVVEQVARRDARRGEWTGFAGPEGAGRPPLDQPAAP